MTALTKKLVIGLSASTLLCMGAAALTFQPISVSAAGDPNVIVEFTENDVELFGEHADASFATDVVTGEETVASVARIDYNTDKVRADYWASARIALKTSFKADNAYTWSFRFYTHLNENGSNPTVAFSAGASGDYVLWKEIDNQGEWNTFTVTREDYALLANDQGEISGFYVSFVPGNGKKYAAGDCYVLLDQVIIDDACAITLDNDKNATGVDPTVVRVAKGSELRAPSSQIFGKGVTWYADAARTTLFDFTGKTAESSITLYGAYSDTLPATRGVVTEFSRADARYFIPKDEQGNTILPADSSSYKTQNHVEYLTDLDIDGDGQIEDCERNMIKVSNWSSARESIGFEFANPVDKDDFLGVTFRIYTNFKGLEAYCQWNCEGAVREDGSVDPYHSGIMWATVQQGRWYNVSFTASKDYTQLFGADGKFDSFVWNFCPVVELGQSTPAGTYVVFGSITYNYKCNVTFDCDTANTGINNVTVSCPSGKAVSEAPAEVLKEGYTVTWYADEARTEKFNLKKDRIEGDITLYAKYEASDFTVTFDYNEAESGIASQNVSVTVGGKVTAPTTTREGYTIKWCVDPELTELYDFDSAVNKSFTLYAKYVKEGGSSGGGSTQGGGCGSTLSTEMIFGGALFTGLAIAFVIKKRKENS